MEKLIEMIKEAERRVRICDENFAKATDNNEIKICIERCTKAYYYLNGLKDAYDAIKGL